MDAFADETPPFLARTEAVVRRTTRPSAIEEPFVAGMTPAIATGAAIGGEKPSTSTSTPT
jgi:hypothetical protein